MNIEDAFLQAILNRPADDAPRLIYADWLDENDIDKEAKRSRFLRLTVKIAAMQTGHRRSLIETQRRSLSSKLPTEWLALVGNYSVEACDALFAFKCPKQWASLGSTSDVRIRSCEACNKNVHFCDTVGEAREHARAGHCIALRIDVRREPDDLQLTAGSGVFEQSELMMVGRPNIEGVAQPTESPPTQPTVKLRNRPQKSEIRRRRKEKRSWVDDNQ